MVNPRIRIEEGELEGTLEISQEGKEYYSFKGIPYAEPPVGHLRFKPPVPKTSWFGVYDATREGNPCAHIEMIRNSYSGSEDCLFLNVFTSDVSEDGDPRPVMFFIHGGAFIMGSGGSDWFTPDFIVAKDVVLVTINYRLGALGFLCLDTKEAPGNVGLRDQNLALKWVKKNIKSFNGDPDKVTIFGISAGSASVEYHLLSPMSRGLFHKAILQSGSTLNPWASLTNKSQIINLLAKELGVDSNDKSGILKKLQKLDVESLVHLSNKVANNEVNEPSDWIGFLPVVEQIIPGVEPFLSEAPLSILSSRKFYSVPTIAGFCENEGVAFMMRYPNQMEDFKRRNFVNCLQDYFKINKVQFEEVTRDAYDQDNVEAATHAFLSDLCFLGGIYYSLKCRTRGNDHPNYLYMFTHVGSLNLGKFLFKCDGNTAIHGDDSSYLGSNALIKDIPATPEDIQLRNQMVQMWTDFAKTGTPTPQNFSEATSDLTWLPVTHDKMDLLEIGKQLAMTPLPMMKRMQLWGSLYDSILNNK